MDLLFAVDLGCVAMGGFCDRVFGLVLPILLPNFFILHIKV